MQEPKPEPKPIEPMSIDRWLIEQVDNTFPVDQQVRLLSEAREWMRLAVELQTGLADLEASESLRRGT